MLRSPFGSLCELLSDVALDLLEEVLAVVGVNVKCQLLGEVEAENTHDGLCVDRISAGHDIHVVIAAGHDADKVLDIVNGVDVYLYCFHNDTSFPECVYGCFLCSEFCHFVEKLVCLCAVIVDYKGKRL